ncbi:Forkhead box protein B2, partial [Podochytrium sp. JEL0797]
MIAPTPPTHTTTANSSSGFEQQASAMLDSLLLPTEHAQTTPTAQPAPQQQEPVQAYAKIEGKDFTYFVRKLSVVIGRKIQRDDNVDVHLGNVKSISRNHAKIQFNFTIQTFEILVTGKNGAVVDGIFVAVNSAPVPLYNKSKITIGEIECQFLLPKTSNDATDPPPTVSAAASASSLFNQPLGFTLMDPNLGTPNSNAIQQHLNHMNQQLEKVAGGRAKSSGAGGAVKKAKQNHRAGSIYDEDGAAGASAVAGVATAAGGGGSGEEYPRPQHSYAAMISQAILASADRKLALAEIYHWIMETYPYYKTVGTGWQ